MERQRKRWTPQEERVLINQVSRHADNLSQAFREAARLLGRSETSVSLRWYKTTRHKEETGICFALVSKYCKGTNKKVDRLGSTRKRSWRWWNSLLKLLKS